jgi:hypothetical protein
MSEVFCNASGMRDRLPRSGRTAADDQGAVGIYQDILVFYIASVTQYLCYRHSNCSKWSMMLAFSPSGTCLRALAPPEEDFKGQNRALYRPSSSKRSKRRKGDDSAKLA